MRVRVGKLRNGDYFRTLHTKRMGVVTSVKVEKVDHDGVNVRLVNPTEAKSLHIDVFVEVYTAQ